MLRDPDEAADVMQETFMRAMKALSGERAGAAASSTWLFTIARNLALTRLARGKRTAPLVADEDGGGGEQRAFQLVDPDRFVDPQETTQAKETASLVWQAAAALNPKEYSLLDLHIRQGLDSAEISEVLGVSKGNARTMLSRLKDAFEDAFTSLVMFQHGRRRCEVLDNLIREHDFENLSVPARKLIMRHTSECQTCQEQRRRLVSAESVLRSLVPLPLPLLLKRRIAEAATKAWPSATGGAAGGGRAGGSAFRTVAKTALGKATAVGGWKAAALGAALLVTGGGIASVVTSQVTGSRGATQNSSSVEVSATWETKEAVIVGEATPPPTRQTPPHEMTAATIVPVRTLVPVISPASPAPPTAIPSPVPPAPTETPAPACGAPQPVVLGPASADDSYASAMLDLSNQYRAQQGLPALIPDSRLNSAAAEHAQFVAETRWWTIMQGTQIHLGADCRDMYDRAIAAGYPPAWIGENVMWGSVGLAPSDLFNIMLNSVDEDPANTIFAYTGIACFVRSSTSPAEFACVQVYASVPNRVRRMTALVGTRRNDRSRTGPKNKEVLK